MLALVSIIDLVKLPYFFIYQYIVPNTTNTIFIKDCSKNDKLV